MKKIAAFQIFQHSLILLARIDAGASDFLFHVVFIFFFIAPVRAASPRCTFELRPSIRVVAGV